METNKIEFYISEKEKELRLDMALSKYDNNHSRSYWQRLITSGNVSINGSIIKEKKYKVNEGMKIEVEIPQDAEVKICAENIPLNIVYEDNDLMIIDKPKGMVVHPAVGNYTGTLVNGIMFHCKDRLSSINGEIRPGIVHRIDKNTSGLLMIAKNDNAHNCLATQLKEHTINRKYKAIVYNNFQNDDGTVDLPLGRDPRNRLKQAVVYEGGRKAVTHYKVIERFGKFTFLECSLETGRTHQIRVHMSYIKHPLLGDDVYGPEKNKFGIHGQMLHAYLIGFVHPVSGEYMEFRSSLPDEFENVLEKLRKEK